MSENQSEPNSLKSNPALHPGIEEQNDERESAVPLTSPSRQEARSSPFPTNSNFPTHKAHKVRLDQLVVERKLAAELQFAQRMIMAGEVLVETRVIDKPGTKVAADANVTVRALPQFVSRGGLKLAAALDEFKIDPRGLVALDVGASTGGFSDCLLQRGIAQIFAVDVGYGQLAWKVRRDPRVVAIERTNIRYLEELPGSVLADLAVIDASFISLKLVLPATLRLLTPRATVIALVKPQFEAERKDVLAGGVVRDPEVHRQVLNEALQMAESFSLTVYGVMASPVLGPAGNIEFLIWLSRLSDTSPPNSDAMIHSALEQAQTRLPRR